MIAEYKTKTAQPLSTRKPQKTGVIHARLTHVIDFGDRRIAYGQHFYEDENSNLQHLEDWSETFDIERAQATYDMLGIQATTWTTQTTELYTKGLLAILVADENWGLTTNDWELVEPITEE